MENKPSQDAQQGQKTSSSSAGVETVVKGNDSFFDNTPSLISDSNPTSSSIFDYANLDDETGLTEAEMFEYNQRLDQMLNGLDEDDDDEDDEKAEDAQDLAEMREMSALLYQDVKVVKLEAMVNDAGQVCLYLNGMSVPTPILFKTENGQDRAVMEDFLLPGTVTLKFDPAAQTDPWPEAKTAKKPTSSSSSSSSSLNTQSSLNFKADSFAPSSSSSSSMHAWNPSPSFQPSSYSYQDQQQPYDLRSYQPFQSYQPLQTTTPSYSFICADNDYFNKMAQAGYMLNSQRATFENLASKTTIQLDDMFIAVMTPFYPLAVPYNQALFDTNVPPHVREAIRNKNLQGIF
jgi:hypothetical protein